MLVTETRHRVALATATLLCGAAVLGWSFHVDPGSGSFYLAAALLAAIWSGGALLAGARLRARGPAPWPSARVVAAAIGLGVGLAAVFVLGAVVVRQIDLLANATDAVLDFARRGSGPAVVAVALVNAVAEEMFFRGALYDVLPVRFALVGTTLLYVLVTMASGNLMLAFAALFVGAVFGLERRRTGHWSAPAITHVTWSLTMLLVLPLLIPD